MQPASDPAHAQTPPGPPPRRGGVIGQLAYYRALARDPIGFVGRRFAEYGDLYFVPGQSGQPGLYVLKHPDHLQDVLLSPAGRFVKQHSALVRMSEVLGNGLLTSDGELWKRHRRMIQPAFHRRRLAEYAEISVAEAERVAGVWTVGRPFDVAAEMMRLTLGIVCRALFSHDITSDTDTVATAMSVFQEMMGKPNVLPPWMPSLSRRRLERAIADTDAIIASMIEARVNGGVTRNDLLQTLVDAVDDEGDGGKMTPQEVRDHLLTLFLAGHETTANTLSWAIYLLARSPDQEAAAVRELAEVVGHEAIGFGHLRRLDYLQRVIKEAMRLYPPAYSIVRRAAEDATIGDYDVPAGSEILMWIYMTHHDPRWYPNPEVFDPDRFLADADRARPKMSYLPFGGGPRACIGREFAMIEATLVLASLLRKFRFRLVPGAQVEPLPRITLAPRGGLPVTVERR